MAVLALLIAWRRRTPMIAIVALLVLGVGVSALALRHQRRFVREQRSEWPSMLSSLLRERYPAQASELPNSLEVRVVAEGLSFPISMVTIPGSDSFLVAEKSGDLRVIEEGVLRERPCGQIAVETEESRGLLGSALSPDFEDDRSLFVYYTDRDSGDNRVARVEVSEDLTCSDPEVLVEGIPDSDPHNGGQLAIDAGHLYITTGDGGRPSQSQSRSNLAGKVLRIETDGDVPADNPFDNEVWAYGLRNPFGITIDSEGTVWATDNGAFCSDELNEIEPGGNYGWGPGAVDDTEGCARAGVGEGAIAPVHRWNPTIAPTAVTHVDAPDPVIDGLWTGDFVFGFLHHFRTTSEGALEENVYSVEEGYRIVDVEGADDGALLVLTFLPAEGTPGKILEISARG